MSSLKEKIAIVTGASRGIGLGIAEQLAANGANVVVVSTKQDKSEAVAAELSKAHGTECMGLACDVSDFESVASMVKAVMDRFSRIDILVNNAGITKDNLLLRMSVEDYESVINVNLNSAFYTIKSVIKPMLKQKYGRIINISSVVGVMGNAGQANYAAAKAGMLGLTKSVAKEFGAKGITCNAVAPGFIETDMTAELSETYLDKIKSEVPCKRLGSVDEIAASVLYLASDSAGYITGQVINVDGGMHM